MKLKSLIAAAALIPALLASCTITDNPVGGDTEKVPVNVTEVTNITPEFISSVSGLEEGQELTPGSTFTLTLASGEYLYYGFYQALMEHIHVHVGDKVYQPEFPATGEEYAQEISLTIPVPDEPFGVVVAYAGQQQLDDNGYTLRLEDNGDGVELFGVSQELKYKYFDCYLRVPEAYTIDQVEFKMGDGEWHNINDFWGCSFSRSWSVDNVYQVSVRPDFENVTGDVTLRVSGTQHHRGKITWKNTEYIADAPEGWQPNSLPESAVGGETVYASFYTKDGYYLAGATSNVDGLQPECWSRAYVSFVMPEQDVEITLDFKEKIPVTYQAGSHITAAEVYSDRDLYYGVPTTTAIPGEYVYLFANAEQGYKPLKAKNDQGEESDFVIYGDGIDRYAYYAQVHVPEGATSLTVTAEAVAAHQVQGQNIYFTAGSTYAAGETVNFIVSVPSGQKIDTVTAADANGADVPVTLDGTYGSFTMPDADVTVTATFKEVDPGENVTIRAEYDEDEYSVYSQSEAYWGRIGSDGVTVPAGTTLYIRISDDYGMPFSVGVKIGDSVQYLDASEDEDTGEYTFGRSFTFDADAVIKVGGSRSAVSF